MPGNLLVVLTAPLLNGRLPFCRSVEESPYSSGSRDWGLYEDHWIDKLSKKANVESIASKEFYSRVYTPFIGLMSVAGITFMGKAGSTTEMVLVLVAAIAGILGGVCMEHGFSLRFIETMPVGASGRDASHHYLDLNEVRSKLQQTYDLVPSVMPGGGPAHYYRVSGSDLQLGFITPISRHFCDTCNRVRLSVDGTLYLCLGQEHTVPLRPLLREGIDDEGLRQAIVEALRLKPARHEFVEKPEQVIRFMSSTGG